jgi:membrane-bound lytic murein transglycosylase B
MLAAMSLLGLNAWLPPAPALAQSVRSPVPYLQRDEVTAYIDSVVAAHGLDRGWIEQVIAQGRYSEAAERLTTPGQQPPWTRDWRQYRRRTVDAARIAEGAAFGRAHAATLARAQARFGVPAAVIVAIIGIESRYGRLTGRHRTLDVLLTLSFDYTRRADLYRDQLAQFLLLCHEQRLDPLEQLGSFAGALGLPQFLPGSIRQFAIDFDGDGRIDLAASVPDAIGSIGSYLYAHGWEPDLPVQLPARTDPEVGAARGRGLRAVHRWRDVAARGVTVEGELAEDADVLLIDLPYATAAGAAAAEFRIGTVNFSALLHYNRSYFYAAAVANLADAIALHLRA